MSAADTFVPLADLLRPAAPLQNTLPPPAEEPVVIAAAATTDLPADPEIRRAIREARLFRARLGDALDARLARLLAGIASDVVMRELRTAPADLAALVARIAAEHAAPPLRVRVARADRDACAAGDVEIVEDATLDRGDAIVEFGAGDVDARLGVRLASVLEALR